MITLVTSWYIFKCKFNKETYNNWIKNFVLNVKKFNLVIFTNEASKHMILPLVDKNPNIKVIIMEVNEFLNYKYKKQWIENHLMNKTLINLVNWQVNMLWSEKINFVKKVVNEKIFDTEHYGWCDIGYFRGRPNQDIPSLTIQQWPNNEKIKNLSKENIYYCQVCSNDEFQKFQSDIIKENIIPPNQISIAGGFFLTHKSNIEWWHTTYYSKLDDYLKQKKLVKDDQIIILDCISYNTKKFRLIKHTNPNLDPWFGFQTFLL